MPAIDAVAAEIRKSLERNFNDLEYLAQLIEDSSISNTAPGNELQSRLVTIFNASSSGSAAGVTHFAKIFSGCKDRGFRRDFQDGSNQVGHFMTAVDMGFRPTQTAAFARSVGVPGPVEFGGTNNQQTQMWEWGQHTAGAIHIPWQEEICVRLIIGHEQVSDRPNAEWYSNALALTTATDDEILTFYAALNRVSASAADLALTRAALNPIHINNGPGNSIMDLHLSLYGYAFGRFIRHDRISTRSAAATWLRWNIGGTFAFHQRS